MTNTPKQELFGIPVRVWPYLPKDSIWLCDENGPKPVVYIENESLLDMLYRAIDSDADFLKKCGVIVHIGDLK